MCHSASHSCATEECYRGKGWVQILPWGRGLQSAGAPVLLPKAGCRPKLLFWFLVSESIMTKHHVQVSGNHSRVTTSWWVCLAQLPNEPLCLLHLRLSSPLGKWKEKDKNQTSADLMYFFMLWQAELDHALACQNRLAFLAGHSQRRQLVQRRTDQPAASHLKMSHKVLLGAWLLNHRIES